MTRRATLPRLSTFLMGVHPTSHLQHRNDLASHLSLIETSFTYSSPSHATASFRYIGHDNKPPRIPSPVRVGTMFSVATMPSYNPCNDGFGSAWNHRPFVSSPLSSSPIRASSPSSPLTERSSSMANRQTQSSPIQPSTFVKFSRYAHQATSARQRKNKTEDREGRRKLFLDQVRRRADERTYQRRDMEGTVSRTPCRYTLRAIMSVHCIAVVASFHGLMSHIRPQRTHVQGRLRQKILTINH